MEHWRKKKTWHRETHFHTINEITNKLCKEKLTQQNSQRTTNKKKKTTYMPQIEFQKNEAPTQTKPPAVTNTVTIKYRINKIKIAN